MALAVWQRFITDDAGNVVSGATVRVRRESDNALVSLYSDRNGTAPLGNPFVAATPLARCYLAGSDYRITATKGLWSAEFRNQAVGTAAEYDIEDVLVLTAEGSAAGALAGRDAFDAEAVGFRYYVTDDESDDLIVYVRTGSSGNWDGPFAYRGPSGAGEVYAAAYSIQGRPRPAELLPPHVFADEILFPEDLATSRAVALVAADDEVVFTLRKNGTGFGTVTFAAAGTEGAFAAAADTTFEAGDVLTILAPADQDLTLADIAITLRGSR